MKKYLYLPTTTLNFNNIFSTESISPFGFYENRGFGYKFFEQVPANPFDHILLLYDKYPEFEIQDDGRDHYPLVFKIEKDLVSKEILQLVCEYDGISVYSVPQTIYLHFSKVEIHFRSQEEMRITCGKAEPSATTKIDPLYNDRLFVFEGEEDCFTWNPSCISKIRDKFDKRIFEFQLEKDRRIDRLKGFAYNFIIGAYKSISPSISSTLSKFRKFKNSEASDQNNNGTSEGDKELFQKACEAFSSVYRDFNGEYKFDSKNGDSIELDMNIWIQRISFRNGKLRYLESLLKIVNEYCLNCGFQGKLEDNRFDTATEIGSAIRTVMGNKWDGSSHQKYINALRKNVKSGSRFDFYSFDHLTMQSVAAFILKGDNLDKLEDFLIANGIGDLRLAFALWGAMFGFSKIPKTQYSLLFEDNDLHYAERIYNLIDLKLRKALQMKISKLDSLVRTDVPVPITDPSDYPLIEKLRQEFTGIEKWIPKMKELFHKHGNQTKKIITEFRKLKIDELGGKIKGVSKKKVEDFLKKQMDGFNTEPSLPGLEEGVKPDQKTSKIVMSSIKKGSAEKAFPKIETKVSLLNISSSDEKKIMNQIDWFKAEFLDPKSKYYGSENRAAKSKIANTQENQRTEMDVFKYLKSNMSKFLSENKLPSSVSELISFLSGDER
jgi:hypothetical protein